MFVSSKFFVNEDKYQYAPYMSDEFKVSVNGEEISVYTCRISDNPFNRAWPGHQRALDQTVEASFVNIVSDEELFIEVTPKKSNYERIILKPYSKNIKTKNEGGRISFELKENGYYVLELDDHRTCLYIFNSKPIPSPEKDSVTYYFGAGVHHVGKLTLHSNESVYVDTNALVFGNIFADGEENIRIFGNGIFNDSCEERYIEHCYKKYTVGNLKMHNCKKVKIEGVGFTNSAIWCVNIFHCFDVDIDGVKVFGQWRYNTDGIDIVNSQRVTVKNSFVHSFDDTIVIKGIDDYAYTNTTDVHVQNCVLWCDWGRACELGYETSCREYKNITFKNCDVLRGATSVCSVHNGDCAEIHDVIFEDIRIELESFYTTPLLQKSEDQVYAETDIARTNIIDINNKRFRKGIDYVKALEPSAPLNEGDRNFAGAHDIIVRDISVYCDEKLFAEQGTKCVRVYINNVIPTTEFYNVSLKNITLNGKALTKDDLELERLGDGAVIDFDIL